MNRLETLQIKGLIMLAICGVLSLVIWGQAFAADTTTPGPKRKWTIDDIVEAPEILGLAVSVDGSKSAVIIRKGNLAENRKISSLYLVDMAKRRKRKIVDATWMTDLQQIPGQVAFSFRADLGKGVQLYKLDGNGGILKIASGTAINTPAGLDLSIDTPTFEPRPVEGVLSYAWSPDGSKLLYTTLHEKIFTPSIRLNSDAVNTTGFIHSYVDLHVLYIGGPDKVVAHQATGIVGQNSIKWRTDGRAFYYKADGRTIDDTPTNETMMLNLDGETNTVAPVKVSDSVLLSNPTGLFQGVLDTKWVAGTRKLVEIAGGNIVHDYGSFLYRIGGSHGGGAWVSPGEEFEILSVRDELHSPHDGLVKLSRGGAMSEITGSGSLSHCSFTPSLDGGVCISQTMNTPPGLVSVKPATGSVSLIDSLDSKDQDIIPLHIEPKLWKNVSGFLSSGYLIYPRDYSVGKRYPAILITHGFDADASFAYSGFQWQFPIQVWAEHGYFIICTNEPSPRQSELLTSAWQQLGEAKRTAASLTPSQMEDLIYLDALKSFEGAIGELVDAGMVDPAKVGIVGYSRGAQMVNLAMTQSNMFKAASSGDGGVLNPSNYWEWIPVSQWEANNVFGGSPFDPATLEHYRRLSPALRAHQASGPILQQIQIGSGAQFEFYGALQAARIPTELIRYDGETHIFHVPRDRKAAMEQNLDWFDFWLLGKRDPDPAKSDQYNRWDMLK